MKKIRILAVAIAILALLTAVPMSASAANLTVDNTGKVDVLEGATSMMMSKSNCYFISTVLTDGVFADNEGTTVYYNKAFCAKGDCATLEDFPGEFEYTLTDGTKKTYYYTFEFTDLNANVDSFAIYYNNNNTYPIETEHFPFYHIDSEAEILISTDGGKTYSVAWHSTPFKMNVDNTYPETCHGYTVEEGGDFIEVNLKNDAGEINCTYKYMESKFDKEYKNVTNIVYCSVHPRREGKQTTTDGVTTLSGVTPFYYATRMTEFDVYGSVNATVETTEAVTEAATSAKPVETKAPETQETKAPETVAETVAETAAETKAPETQAPAAEKKGCGSSLAAGAVVLTAILGSALLKKKD